MNNRVPVSLPHPAHPQRNYARESRHQDRSLDELFLPHPFEAQALPRRQGWRNNPAGSAPPRLDLAPACSRAAIPSSTTLPVPKLTALLSWIRQVPQGPLNRIPLRVPVSRLGEGLSSIVSPVHKTRYTDQTSLACYFLVGEHSACAFHDRFDHAAHDFSMASKERRITSLPFVRLLFHSQLAGS